MSVEVDRRLFLRFLGAGLTGVAASHATPLGPLAGSREAAAQGTFATRSPFADFRGIDPSTRDELVLPDGFTHDVIALWGDRLPGTNVRFGYNADYTAFFPTAADGSEGVLVVNHENLSMPAPGQIGVYLQTFPQVMGRVAEIEDEMHDVGLSVLRIRRDAARSWQIVASPITRRYDARSAMRTSGPALQHVRDLRGTLANCSGCQTPWNTVLTCEENIQNFVPPEADTAGHSRTGGRFRLDGSHYGWVVEIDPMDPDWVPVKHTLLGRFRHENVAIRAEADRQIAAYMGDDRINGHVYKFVSARSFAPDSADTRGSLLATGRLYAAFFRADGTGEWRELSGASPLRPNPGSDMPTVPKGATTLGQVYADFGAIVTDAYRASNLIGATPTGRPEDVEVHPVDGSVYIAFTENATAPASLFPNLYGEIWRIREEEDAAGLRFTWARWKAGGPNDPAQRGHVFAAPDNLSFDPNGDLWVVCNIATVRLNGDPRYTTFQNNGMFFIPTSGDGAGVPRQFASGPCESELTGPSWTPDRQTLFLSVQHPGEGFGMRTAEMSAPRGSNWPSGRVNEPPRPGVVSVHRG